MPKNEMEQNIKDYGSEIISLETFVEAVRQMPGMYIGRVGNKGYLNMFREIYQNSIDELMKNSSPCDHAIVSYDERTHMFIIEDNGRGIPHGRIIDIFTKEHTSSNYKKKPGEYSSGTHGVGGKVTNALCSELIIESYILGKAKRVRFVEGIVTKDGEVDIPNPNNKQGTIISFRPCYEVMGEITLKAEEVLGLIRMIMQLTKIGAVTKFNAILLDGTKVHEDVINEDGIITDLILKTVSPLIAPIIISEDTGYMKADIALTYDSNDLNEANITSFSNFCPTSNEESTHVLGVMDGFSRFFRVYMNKIYLAGNKKNKLVVNNTDIKTGLKAVIAVSHLNPIFTGQAKDVLGNEDMRDFTSKLVYDSLNDWSKQSPSDLQKVCKYIKEIAEIRVNSEKDKVKLSNKYETSVFSKGLPKKYTRPNGKKSDLLELIIVEGDSAGGSLKNSRDDVRQGVFPIRGKMPNPFTIKREKYLANAEVAGIISIIGGGYGKNFDINKVIWDKIIIGADADPDGKHIRVLLLKLFLLFMTDMIKAGKIYSAVPPLYGAEIAKNKTKYFTDRFDFVKYNQSVFCKSHQITNSRGTVLNSKDITNLLYTNIDYTYQLNVLASRYALDPNLLEFVITNMDKGFDKLQGLIKSKYRFLEMDKKNNNIIINGVVDYKYQTMIINDRMYEEMKPVIEILNQNIDNYAINGIMCSFYELMTSYENSMPSNVTRYKGLGEMNAQNLQASTFAPDSGRTLMQYTMESATEEIEKMRYYESNRSELIKNTKATRFDLIG